MNTDRVRQLLEYIYGNNAAAGILPPLGELLAGFAKEQEPAPAGMKAGTITHKDAFLICYGDMISAAASGPAGDASALGRLEKFLETWNRWSFTYLHLLPFHPYFDFVINHGSAQSDWFRRFLAGEERFKNWYLTRPADYDWSTVTRPRTHPLLTAFTKSDGSTAHVWTTFSADQADYDFSRPEVLLEFIDIFLNYCRRGGRMLRLDAIAYLWKEDGTSCLHHPKTHAVVQLLRAITDGLGLPMLLLTETNVPHAENISYFGGGQRPEAHLVYNFALPPLTLHAAISGDAAPLRRWAAALPALPAGNCFLNFLASHDGVGLTPAKGLVDDAAFARTLEEAQKRGALISMKSAAGGPVPYELNCAWADMTAPESLGPPELQARAFLTAYAVALALPGLPAVYFHSWTGSRAWKAGPELLGYNRAINREKPAIDRLEAELAGPGSFRSLVMAGFQKLLGFRAAEAAFDPAAPSRVLENPGTEGIFALIRGPDHAGGSVLCAQNFSPAGARLRTGVPSLGDIDLPARGLRWIAFDSGGARRELVL